MRPNTLAAVGIEVCRSIAVEVAHRKRPALWRYQEKLAIDHTDIGDPRSQAQ